MRWTPVILSVLLATAAPMPLAAQSGSDAGAYLAARAAVFDGNHRVAAAQFEAALAADPENPSLIGNAIFANAALGQWDRAGEIIAERPTGADVQDLVNLVGLVQAIRAGDLAGARGLIDDGQGAGPFIDALAIGWLYLGEGDMARAEAAFKDVARDPGLADMALTHLAYARGVVGDFEGADALLSGDEAGPLSASERSVRARAEILVQLDRRTDALELLTIFTQAVPDPALLALQSRIETGDSIPEYAFITTAEQGLAEVFFSVALAIGTEGGSTTLPLLYTRAAHGIHPGHSEALLYSGELLRQDNQYDLAAETYALIPEEDDQYIEAQLGRADAYFDAGQEDEAVSVLQDLAAARPELATVQAGLGDLLRRTDQCDLAIEAYTAALDQVDLTQQRYWFLYYTRGICFERIGDYDASEVDFRQALVLNPDQPSVLNNLGYSLVEQRRNLDEALDMIERAVEGRPESGYIVDSLAWVYYRLGRFEEAVEPMERAAALLPNDPIINDHLGDVYWMVGRYREAEFQWHRALSFEPEEEDADRIRRKLDVGLYTVLEEEGGVGASQ